MSGFQSELGITFIKFECNEEQILRPRDLNQITVGNLGVSDRINSKITINNKIIITRVLKLNTEAFVASILVVCQLNVIILSSHGYLGLDLANSEMIVTK